MDTNDVQLIGSPCGQHGPYTFYKAFKYTRKGVKRIVTLSEFFFVKLWIDSDLLCIGELQLLWNDKNSDQVLASLRLYFLPENTPEGRMDHGEDEVLAISEKVVLRVEDLITWITVNAEWTWGRLAKCEDEVKDPISAEEDKNIISSLTESSLDFSDVEKERKTSDYITEQNGPMVVILSYPRYCRYRAMMRRLEGVESDFLKFRVVNALGGFVTCSRNTRVLFCKDTFDYPELETHELLCNHLAPKLKGRPRGKRKKRSVSPGSESNESESSVSNVFTSKIKEDSRNGIRCDNTNNLRRSTRSTEHTESKQFLKELNIFMKTNYTPIGRIPSLGYKELDLYSFYARVQKLGGYDTVNSNRLWKSIFEDMSGHQNSTSATTVIRRHYERFLLPYERHAKGEEYKPLPLYERRRLKSKAGSSASDAETSESTSRSGNSTPVPQASNQVSPTTPTTPTDNKEFNMQAKSEGKMSSLRSVRVKPERQKDRQNSGGDKLNNNIFEPIPSPSPVKEEPTQPEKIKSEIKSEAKLEGKLEEIEEHPVQPTTPKIETTSPKFEATSPKVEPKSPKVEPTSPKFEPKSPKVEPASPKVETTAPKLEPTALKLEPSALKLEPTALKLEPTALKFEPAALKLEPTVQKLKLTAQKIEPTVLKVEPTAPKVELVVVPEKEPEPLTSAVAPVPAQNSTPEPLQCKEKMPIIKTGDTPSTNNRICNISDTKTEIIEVPYKPKVINFDSPNEEKTFIQEVKKRKLDILKEGGLEVTPVRSCPPVSIDVRPSVIQQAGTITATKIKMDMPPPSPMPHPRRTNITVPQATTVNQTSKTPSYMNGNILPRVVQSKSIYSYSEKMVYGDPKDYMLPPNHNQVLTPRFAGPPRSMGGDVLDLTVTSPQKPAIEIMKVPSYSHPYVSPFSLSEKPRVPPPAPPLLDGRRLGSNLEITLVGPNKPNIPAQPKYISPPSQPYHRYSQKRIAPDHYPSQKIPRIDENGKFITKPSSVPAMPPIREPKNNIEISIPHPFTSRNSNISKPEFQRNSLHMKPPPPPHLTPPSAPNSKHPPPNPSNLSYLSQIYENSKNIPSYLPLIDPVYYSAAMQSIYSHGPHATPPILPVHVAEQFKIYTEYMARSSRLNFPFQLPGNNPPHNDSFKKP